jgi:hypothetical protein
MTGISRLPHLADAVDLIQWSDRVTSRTEFPGLLARLIAETNDQVTYLEMRDAEGSGVSGYDGIVHTSRGTPFVPLGKSVWELGTGIDPQRKANADYTKRTEDALGVDKATTTFVFATSRRWPNKEEWAERRRKEGQWQDVRTFDVDNIVQTMVLATHAHFWVSERVGKPATSIRTLEDWWQRFSDRTLPELTPALILCGPERVESAFRLLKLLEEDRRFTAMKAKSIEDGLAFIAAAVLSSTEETRNSLLRRALVVHDANALRQLDAMAKLLILLPFEEEMRRQAELVNSHHVVFISTGDGDVDIQLPPVDSDCFREALIEAGVDEQKALRMSRAANKSILAYQAVAGKTRLPIQAWGSAFSSKVVRRAWLAGGWNTQRSGDVDAISALIGCQLADSEEELATITRSAEPIFTNVGATWAVIAPEDTWSYACPHLAEADLQALEIAVQTALGAVNPALALAVEDRWKAALEGKTRIHSSDLRKGLATTLALLGTRGADRDFGSGHTAEKVARKLVFELLERANADSTAELWSSLSDILPLLAESAPDVFLRAVEAALNQDGPLLKGMFADSRELQGAFGIDSPHTGLLWALELIAWSPQHFALAVEQLVRLCEIDPGGQLGNRPLNSLLEILSPWMPQTSAVLSQRIASLRAVQTRHQTVGWQLLLGLLRHDVGHPTYGPRFRDWKTEHKISRPERRDYESAIGEEMLASAERSPQLFLDVLKEMNHLSAEQRSRAIDDVDSLRIEVVGEPLALEIWNAVQEAVRRHREFPDAAWTLRADDAKRLENAAAKLVPVDPVERHRWLFDEYMPGLGIDHSDMKAYEAAVAEARRVAAEGIWNHGELAAIIRLAEEAKLPVALGIALASCSAPVDQAALVDLLDSASAKLVELAKGYIATVSELRLDWILARARLKTGRPTVQARLLNLSGDLKATWTSIEEFDPEVETVYWREFVGYGRGQDFPLVNEVGRRLLGHGRVAYALDLLNMYSHSSKPRVDPQLVMEAFGALLERQDDPEMHVLSGYDIQHLLEYLRQAGVEDDGIANLEWALLPALPYESPSPTLEKQLSQNPAFFVKMLSLLYRPKHKEPEQQVPAHIAQNAYHLLEDWKQVPGSESAGGRIDSTTLRAWVNEARTLAAEADRLKIADIHIGHVLAYAGEDDDGMWPAEAVRTVIEEISSPELERGFRTATYNKRGVTSRALGEGGAQEYRLAERFDEWAKRCLDRWPRTATVLGSMADEYRAEGRLNDEEARKFKEGLDF